MLKDARQAFGVTSYKDSPLRNFQFDKIDVTAKIRPLDPVMTAGWTFAHTQITTSDGSRVAIKDCENVSGLK